jgi:CheY-like chemotaxis protein
MPGVEAPFVVVADAGRPFGTTLGPILARLGCRVATPEDGTTAFRLAVAERPALIIVSVHLGGLSGVAICEGVKNSPHLKGIKVAIVGSSLSADLFNRDTALAYGADLFLEEEMSEADLSAALESVLPSRMPGAGVDGEPGDDISGALDDLTADTGGTPPGVGEEIRRLARIMLADLRLYNPDRFRDAIRSRSVLDVFRDELQRGRSIVDSRFPQVAARQDLLAAALREGMEREHASAGSA